jgi:hypothetical protein
MRVDHHELIEFELGRAFGREHACAPPIANLAELV